jgi:hypothetical protein
LKSNEEDMKVQILSNNWRDVGMYKVSFEASYSEYPINGKALSIGYFNLNMEDMCLEYTKKDDFVDDYSGEAVVFVAGWKN